MNKKIIKAALSAVLATLPLADVSAASDDQLLLTASRVNIDEAIAHECDVIVRNYWRAYQINLDALTAEVLEPMGITKSVRKRAAQIPEAAPDQYVKAFQSSTTEQQLEKCLNMLIDIQGGLYRARQNVKTKIAR